VNEKLYEEKERGLGVYIVLEVESVQVDGPLVFLTAEMRFRLHVEGD